MDVKISALPAGTASSTAIVAATNAAGTTTEKVTLGDIAALAANQSLDTTDSVTFNSVTLPNYTQIVVGSFDNSTGGANGLGLICAVGYELNWQGGRLKSVYNNATQTIYVDSPLRLSASGLTFSDGSSLTSAPASLAPTDGSVTDAKITSGGLSASVINWAAITEWAASTAYAKGDLVNYKGVAYRRSTAGTTGATFNSANWQQITPSVNVTVSPTQLSASANDYAGLTGDIHRMSSSSAVNITGIVAGVSGEAKLLVNVGTFAITLKHASTSSTAANRMSVPWAGDYVLDANGGAALVVYDATSSLWRVV